MTSSRTWTALALTALALTGCSYSVNGTPLPGAGSAPPSAPATSSADAPPKIGRQRSVAGVDPCSLLTTGDLADIGPPKKEPARKDDVIPESCQYVLDDGTPAGRTVVTALYQKYEQVRARQAKGSEEVLEGHSAWVLCDLSGNEMACTVTIAVNANRSVLVAMTQPGGAAERMLAVMRPLVRSALNRLPPA
ncbi:hypothetical protein JOF41_000302 [Saccharothrix coeruleofusca]|uniref:DUF3558 domain-containing protein n=1 Tax=Saccharothrix coeruleofusca TaxID=33919 RepID=UPI001AE55954|nr:DUF3558 domain-containing protein [Saccharothrix coeruleofusca]MBP2334124.1 hypothetical protein [Saccharothrix coeruleofusca]